MPRPADPRVKIDLLRAAEAAFVEHGLAAAKVEDITTRAGVSKGSFYLHFESKDDCFRQIVESFCARLAAIIEPPPSDRSILDLPVAETRASWHAHMCDIFEFCWQNRALLGMIQTGGGGTPFGYLIDEFAERAAKQTEAATRQAIASGIYRKDIDPALATALLSGAMDRLSRVLIQQPKRPDIAAWAAQALDIFLNGLLVDDARREAARPAAEGGPADAATIIDHLVRNGRKRRQSAAGAAGAAGPRRAKAG